MQSIIQTSFKHIYTFMYAYQHLHDGAVIIPIPAFPLPIELVATIENV